MLLYEISRFRDNLFRVIDDGGVVGMLFSKLVEYSRRDLMFVRESGSCRISAWKIFFVERQCGLIDGGLRLLKVGSRVLHDFFHRQVRREGETQLLSVLLRAKAEVAV